MNRSLVTSVCLALALVAGLFIAPQPAAAEGATPNLEELIPVYRQLQTDPKFIGLQSQLRGNVHDRQVVDRYLEYLPISPLSMLEIDMHLGRYEFKVPKLVWQWHMRWLELHPKKAERMFGIAEPVRELEIGSGAEGAVSAKASVTTNRNAAFNYPLPPEEYQGEIQVVVNPADPSQIVAAANTWDDINGTCGDGIQAVFFSGDGGDTWGYTCPPHDVDYGLNCAQDFGGIIFGSDPALFWNDNNQVILEHMLLCYDGVDFRYSIVDAISSDGGANWSAQGVVIDSWASLDLEDKNFYAIDNNAGSPFHGNHYTCWDRNNNEKSAWSSDNGQTWNEVDLPDTAGAASGCSAGPIDSRFDLACELEVGKDGTVHVVFDTLTCGFSTCSCEQMFYARSTDGGQSWSSPVQVRNFNLVGFSNDATPPAQNERGVNPFGAIGIDNSGGACDGNLYVTFTDHTGGGAASSDVWLTRSTDNGATWSAPVKVNDDATSNIQFHPFLQVDQSNGNPVIAWHDARNDPNNEEVDIFVTRSTDCGLSVEPNIQVTAPSAEFNNATISWSNQNSGTNPNYNPNQYGEYLGLDVLNNTAYIAWSDSRHFFPGSTGETQQENLGFAKVTFVDDTTPPAAPTNLAATGGVGVVDLDWDDNAEADLAGYNVYRATTAGGPYSQVNGSLVAASAYSDGSVTGGTTYFYVVTAVDAAANESANSNEASATPSEPQITTLHVDSIVVGTQNQGGGNKLAVATVTIVDELGSPVADATVSGSFTGDITASDSGVTAGDGTVTLTAGPKKGRLNFTFCVDDVTHATLTYAPGDNVQTCASN